MPAFDGIGFDLLTALLDTRALWSEVAGDTSVGARWQETAQSLLRGRAYRPYEDVVREAAGEVGLSRDAPEKLFERWREFRPWPDVPTAMSKLSAHRRFIVTNCSERLGSIAASRVGTFDLVMTAERAGAYKPDPRPYRAALDALHLDPRRVLFVAGSAHDVGGAGRVGMTVYWVNRYGATAPTDAVPLVEAPTLERLDDALAPDRSAAQRS
jgi:2-haloacid dehalogenase